jgi:hypothetical protein
MLVPIRVGRSSVHLTQRTAVRTAVCAAINYLWPAFNRAIDRPNVSTGGPTELRGELVQLDGMVQDGIATLQL